MSIIIKTRLHDSIYPSQGGGQTIAHYTYKTGPRNLLKAINQWHKWSTYLVDVYGNIGCGQTWVEVENVPIDPFELHMVESPLAGTPTEAAKELLSNLNSAKRSMQ